ncbi:MAG: primase-like DNA-binding domain-containing protein [Methanoregula sp.]
MGAGKETVTGWQQTLVLVRSDIIAAAGREHLDIGEECNRALAKRLGIEYQPLPKTRPENTSRVIVAPEGIVSEQSGHTPAAPPVINAEDPTVPGKVLREKKEKKATGMTKPQAPVPETVPQHHEAPARSAVTAQVAPKTGRKSKKEDPIKRFVSTRIVREAEESPDAIIAKDELYQRFERWCRDHNYTTIPERRAFTVALKNKYALAERTIGGVPSWTSIRIK